jgi:hypothetical protein
MHDQSEKTILPEAGDASQEFEVDIRRRAYTLWELEGRPEGRAEQYWHRARELIENETRSAYPPTQSRGHRN